MPGGNGPSLVWKRTKVTGRLMYTSGKHEPQPFFADSFKYNLNTDAVLVHFWMQGAANDAHFVLFFFTNHVKMCETTASKYTHMAV